MGRVSKAIAMQNSSSFLSASNLFLIHIGIRKKTIQLVWGDFRTPRAGGKPAGALWRKCLQCPAQRPLWGAAGWDERGPGSSSNPDNPSTPSASGTPHRAVSYEGELPAMEQAFHATLGL